MVSFYITVNMSFKSLLKKNYLTLAPLTLTALAMYFRWSPKLSVKHAKHNQKDSHIFTITANCYQENHIACLVHIRLTCRGLIQLQWKNIFIFYIQYIVLGLGETMKEKWVGSLKIQWKRKAYKQLMEI